MTQIEWQQLEAAVAKMTEAERSKLANLLVRPPAPAADAPNPSLGLFADDPDLIDELLEGVYAARENHPWRASH
jgi:hypothetical protein